MTLFLTLGLAVAALLTATLSGFLGMGGGMVLLGIMSLLLPAPLVVPIHGVVQLVSNGTRTLLFIHHIRWRIFFVYVGPATVGLIAATFTMMQTGQKLVWFKPVIGLFIICYLIYRKYKTKVRNLPLFLYAPVGLVVGFLTIFVGSTGPFLAPFFLRDDFNKENVIATKAACQIWLHIAKIPAFLSIGFDYIEHWKLLIVLVAMVVVGTFFGKKLLGKISEEFFLTLFQIVLGAIAILLLARGLPAWF